MAATSSRASPAKHCLDLREGFHLRPLRVRGGGFLADQGAHVTYLGPEGSQIGHKESIKDTALSPCCVSRIAS